MEGAGEVFSEMADRLIRAPQFVQNWMSSATGCPQFVQNLMMRILSGRSAKSLVPFLDELVGISPHFVFPLRLRPFDAPRNGIDDRQDEADRAQYPSDHVLLRPGNDQL